MGPVALFDKSFLQTLTVDEAAVFDAFFMTNVCPVFLAEVLADLTKQPDNPQAAQRLVETLAHKTPTIHSYPNGYHRHLARAELLGERVSMDGRPILLGGRYVRDQDGLHARFEQPPEAVAFDRWQRGRFQELDREYAAKWREMLASLNLKGLAADLRKLKDGLGQMRTLADARRVTTQMMRQPDAQWQVLRSICEEQGLAGPSLAKIRDRWAKAGRPPISDFAPYALFVYEVDTFFALALMLSQISPERPSNKIDISYLYYLPFCKIFISNDNLHARTAPLFTSDRQEFVDGRELKTALGALNTTLLALPEQVRDEGLMRVAHHPPSDLTGMVAALWDKYLPGWREERSTPQRRPRDISPVMARHDVLDQLPQADPLFATGRGPDEELNSMGLQRRIPLRMGSWHILPKGFRETR